MAGVKKFGGGEGVQRNGNFSFLGMISFAEKINRNSLGPNIFDLKLTQLTYLLSFPTLFTQEAHSNASIFR